MQTPDPYGAGSQAVGGDPGGSDRRNPADQTGSASGSLQPRVEPPLLLGRYRIVETRGSGGFGSVRVCWDVRLERKVAIKCIPLAQVPNSASSTLAEALDEARITSRLSHPNIVTVHDFQFSGGYAYLIMEYVDGLTLAELLGRVEDGQLTYDECAHVLDSLAGALDYAHGHGVLHLDIKPSNVLINIDGTVKLGDFGMASLASAAGWEGARGGTVGYMPPEQLQGGYVDERTDVFALGVVCYQALTGISPFLAKDADASLRKIERGAKAVSKVEPELKGPVSDGLAAALSAEQATRPATAGELEQAVLPYLGDEAEGRGSLIELLAQARGECGPDEETWDEAARVPLTLRWPWLVPGLCRIMSAVACGGVAWRLAPVIAEGSGTYGDPDAQTLAWVGPLVAAAVAALSPEAGGTLGCALFVAAVLATGVYSPAFLVATLAILALLGWRLAAVGTGRLAHAALLLPLATGSPVAGAAMAAAILPPLAALATGAAGAALALVGELVTHATSGTQLAQACAQLVASPDVWVTVLGCGLAAWTGSLAGGRHGGNDPSRTRAVLGQVCCAAGIALFSAFSARVENGGLWEAPQGSTVAVAVVCAVLMSMAIVTLGPTPTAREVE